jgi:hypothetical protein
MINKAGKYLIQPRYWKDFYFIEGLAEISVRSMRRTKDQEGKQTIVWEEKHGYIDGIGKIVIDLSFDQAFYFSQGLAPVRIGDVLTGKWGFIDKSGHFVINPQFDYAEPFSEGLAPVSLGDVNGTDDQPEKWGYIAR